MASFSTICGIAGAVAHEGGLLLWLLLALLVAMIALQVVFFLILKPLLEELLRRTDAGAPRECSPGPRAGSASQKDAASSANAETEYGGWGFSDAAPSGGGAAALQDADESGVGGALPACAPGGFGGGLVRAGEALLAAIQGADAAGMEVAMQSVRACLSGAGSADAGAAKAAFLSIYRDVQQLLYDFDEEILDRQAVADTAAQRLGAVRGGVNECAAVILELSRQIAAHYRERSARKKTDIVLQAKRFIENNFQSSLTVNEIAAALFISAPYLYRLMREELGISPAHYLNNLRIRYSTAMLKNTDRPITAISSEAGFETEQSFYRQFRKQMGCTPSQYRSQFRP